MPVINVAKAFILSLDSGEKLNIGVGEQRVSDEVAMHWYTQAHLAGVYRETPWTPRPAPTGTQFLNAVTERWRQQERWDAWAKFEKQLNARIAREERATSGERERREAAKQKAAQARHERELLAFARNVANWRQQLPGMCNPHLILALDREIAEFEHDWLDPDEAGEVANIAAGSTWHRRPSSTVH